MAVNGTRQGVDIVDIVRKIVELVGRKSNLRAKRTEKYNEVKASLRSEVKPKVKRRQEGGRTPPRGE
jgi:hypothetical protein